MPNTPGSLGVCLATSGPGGIHLLNGLYDAKLDGQPVLAITGHAFHDLIDTHTQQDVDLDRLFSDVAVYNTRVMGCAHVRQRDRSRLPDGVEFPGRRSSQYPDRHSGSRSATNARSEMSRIIPRKFAPGARGFPAKTTLATRGRDSE